MLELYEVRKDTRTGECTMWSTFKRSSSEGGSIEKDEFGYKITVGDYVGSAATFDKAVSLLYENIAIQHHRMKAEVKLRSFEIKELYGEAWQSAIRFVYNVVASSFDIPSLDFSNNENTEYLEQIADGFNLRFDVNGDLE